MHTTAQGGNPSNISTAVGIDSVTRFCEQVKVMLQQSLDLRYEIRKNRVVKLKIASTIAKLT
jgi:hypothetical protein